MNVKAVRNALLLAIRRDGTIAVSRRLGISRLALLAFVADVPRNAGTDALISARAASERA